MALALFDLDHTLLSTDSDSACWQFLFDKKLVNVNHYQPLVKEHIRQYHLGKMDIQSYFLMIAECLAKFSFSDLKEYRKEYLQHYIEPMIQAKTAELLNKHRQAGDTLVLITATHDFIAEPIAQRLDIEHFLSSELAKDENGFTGKIGHKPCYQDGKVYHLKNWLQGRSETLDNAYFYSDSQNDLPLLKLVSNPVAVNPDRVLQDYAEQQNWPVISLSD